MKETLNIYLVSQSYNTDYDTYDSFVVAETDEESARRRHPDGCLLTVNMRGCFEYYDDDGDLFCDRTWVPDIRHVKVQLIGECLPNAVRGHVFCASFHAG
jgi:hypothetical protein